MKCHIFYSKPISTLATRDQICLVSVLFQFLFDFFILDTIHTLFYCDDLGCIHLLNTHKYFDNTCKCCGNTHEYWPNSWKMCSPASAIFMSIVTILVSFEAILSIFVRIPALLVPLKSWWILWPNCQFF